MMPEMWRLPQDNHLMGWSVGSQEVSVEIEVGF